MPGIYQSGFESLLLTTGTPERSWKAGCTEFDVQYGARMHRVARCDGGVREIERVLGRTEWQAIIQFLTPFSMMADEISVENNDGTLWQFRLGPSGREYTGTGLIERIRHVSPIDAMLRGTVVLAGRGKLLYNGTAVMGA